MSEEYLIEEGFTVEFLPNEHQFIIEVIDKKTNTGFTSHGRNYQQLWSNAQIEYDKYKQNRK
tara:strand:+ start:5028 stop:5213 length:186 start_codon:yes stop_codon:yes gene_type:complete